MKIIFLGWIILKETIDIALHLINLRYSIHKNRKVPKHLKNVITKERYELSKSYLKDHTNFHLVSTVINIIITLLFLLFLIEKLDVICQILTKNLIWQGLIFFGILFLINFLTSIPLSFFETFRIEAKYGFNKTSLKTFFVDLIKSFFVSVFLGGLILIGVLYLLNHFTYWWLGLSVCTILFFLFAIWLFPVLLLPLFNKFKPLPDGFLKDAIVAFTTEHNIHIHYIFVMDASRRTSHGNAYLTGIGNSRRLVLFDTILEYPIEEIFSIIGHEWGHHVHKDILKQLMVSSLSMVTVLYLSNMLLVSGLIQKSFIVSGTYTLLYLSFLLISPLLYFLNPLTNWLIRKQEFEADRYSLLLTKKIDPAVNSLKRLIRDNLSNLNPHKLYRLVYYTHPAPEERIEYLLKLADQSKIN